MRVFKANYRDGEGKQHEARRWYVDFKDPLGIRRRLPAFESKHTSFEYARKIKLLVDY
jgi:hypothetical protein